jgi:hypothetical protein
LRIAAGVFLILAALINIFAALGYLAGGALSAGAGAVAEAAQAEAEKQGTKIEMTAADKEALDKAKSAGGGLMVFGILLLASVGLSIAGAVQLFRSKGAKFIMVAGGLAAAVEVIGIVLTAFGVTNLIGIIGGILAILAAKSIDSQGASA